MYFITLKLHSLVNDLLDDNLDLLDPIKLFHFDLDSILCKK